MIIRKKRNLIMLIILIIILILLSAATVIIVTNKNAGSHNKINEIENKGENTNSDNPNNPNSPKNPDSPGNPNNTDNPDNSNNSEKSDNSDDSSNSDGQNNPEVIEEKPATPSFVLTPETLTKEDVILSINYSSNSAKKEYKIDDGNWETYTTHLNITKNCIVYAKGINLSGVESDINSISINNIDKIAPETPAIAENTNESTSQLKIISVSYPTDSKTKQYKIDEGDWQTYSNKLNISFNSTIYARAIDEAGNESITSTYSVVLAPVQLETITPEEPIEILGTFDYITNAGDNAVWDAINIDKTMPEGTSISTLLATSNDGVNYSSFSSSINNIQSSRYLKIRINASSQVSALRPTVKGINVLYHFVEESINTIKPIAVISLNQDTNIKTNTSLSWNSDNSYDINQIPIVDEEWQGKQDNFSNPGQYTVKLRVKNSLGTWSEWVQKTIDVQAPINNKPTVEIVMNPQTNITTDTNISWSYVANDADNDSIVDTMWLNNQTRYASQGYYQVQLKVKDSRGAWSDWASKTFFVKDRRLDNPSITVSPTNPTNQNVEATIIYAQTTSNNLYSFDGVNWLTYTGKLTITENKTIYAKGIKDSGEESQIISTTINNIDKIKPEAPVISGNVTTPVGSSGVNISVNYSSDSYLKLYSTDNGVSWEDYVASVNVKSNGKVLAKGIDRAGNESETAEITITNIRYVVSPTYEISPDTTTNGDVLLTINYNDLPGKKYKIGNGEWQDYIAPVTITNNTTVCAKAISDENVESEIININITNIDKVGPADATFLASTYTPTNNNISTTIDYPNDSVIKKYKIDDGEWLDYTNILTITENCTVYAKSYDALENESNISSINISNIDRIDPAEPNISIDTTEPLVDEVNITISYSTDSYYKNYKIDSGNWTSYTAPLNITKNCTIYVKGIDAAGNESSVAEYVVSNINNVLKPIINVDKTSITNQDVIVTIDYRNMLNKKYSFDGTNWIDYTGPITVGSNTTVYAKAIDASDIESSIESKMVTNIDKVRPVDPTITRNPDYETTGNVMVSISYSDDALYRQYSYDSITWYNYVTAINVNSNKTIYAKGVDLAGNESGVVSKAIDNIVTVLSPIISINPTTETNQEVTVTINYQGVSNKKYKIGSGEWLDYTAPITLTENITVYAKGMDDEGFESNIKSYTINNIDKIAPINAWFNASPAVPTNGNVTVNIYYPNDAINRKYKIGEGAWQAYTSAIVLTENAIIYAKSTDSVGNESNVNSITISNIDKINPDAPALSQNITEVTENSVSVTATYSSDSVQKKYKIGDGLWQNYTGVVSLNFNSIVYAKGIDAAGNESNISSINVTNINHKPVAVINMTPSSDITTSTLITWDYTQSTDLDGDEIVAYEWEGALENYVTAGEKTARLRVQDERGLWSDWTSVTFVVQLDWILISETSYIQDATEAVNWISADITQTVPTDTRIKYYYSTSSDGTSWSSETEDINQVADSRYIQVRISYQRLATSSNTPTLNSITINCDRQVFTYVPETMPGKPSVIDIGDNQNASDIQVSFGKANKEMYLSQYRVIVVPLENTNTFNIYEANTISSDKYQVVSLGTTDNIQLRSDLKDSTGADIINNKQYKIYILAVGNSELVKNQLSQGSDDFAITPKPANPIITPDKTEPTNTDVILTITYSPTATVKQYKVGETDIWSNYTGNITLTANNIVYAKCANSEGIESDISSIDVTNIDKTAPSNPAISLSTTSPTSQNVIGNITFADDGVEKLYRVNGGAWITQTAQTAEVTMTDNGSIEAKNKDAAGNWSNITVVNVNNIDRTAPVAPTMSATPTAPTTGMVTLTITYSGDTSTKQYSYDQVTWNTYTAALSISTNRTVYAKGADAAGNISMISSITIANIVVSGPGSPTVADTVVNGDASDLKVTFRSPTNEDNISEYRILAVKNPNVLTTEEALVNSNYISKEKIGVNTNVSENLTTEFKDVDGDAINGDNTYNFYVLSVANEGYTSALSLPSASIKLIVVMTLGFDSPDDVTHQDDTQTEILNSTITLKGTPDATYSPNLIPAMTSSNTPSGVVTGTYPTQAWYAFRNGVDGSNYCATGRNGHYIGYQFATTELVQRYSIGVGSTEYAMRAWSLVASNDGVNWTTLDSASGITSAIWSANSVVLPAVPGGSNLNGCKITRDIASNNQEYKYYRVNMLSSINGYGDVFMKIYMVEFMKKVMGYSTNASGYYVMTKNIDTSNWTSISRIINAVSAPSGTTIKYLVSFDGGVTWKKWTGTAWSTIQISSINTSGGASFPTTINDWNLTGGFQSGVTQGIRIAIGLKTTNAWATPTIDKMTIQYQK